MQGSVKGAKARLRLVLAVAFFRVRNCEGSILDPAHPAAYLLAKALPAFSGMRPNER